MPTTSQSAQPTTTEGISFVEAFELINPHLYTVEERIRAQAKAFDPAVEGYISYICGAGGKRLRPALALLSAGATGKITQAHVDLAVILELIHIATLVHDDIIDGAELRRDQPSANAKWGNSISVLLGDVLFAHALRLSTNFSDSAICRRIADAASEVCSGEIIQTQRRFDLKLTTTDYYRIIEMKTAALFTAACELGAFISEASPSVIGSLKTFGTKLGVAYQIYDDILDLAGNEEDIGKTLGTDLQKGKFTLPVLLMLQSGKDVAELRELLLKDDESSLSKLSSILQEAGSIDAAKAIALRLINESIEQLSPIQDNRYARGLHAIPGHLRSLIQAL
jgi:octaprenyl-diphosphate synthase